MHDGTNHDIARIKEEMKLLTQCVLNLTVTTYSESRNVLYAQFISCASLGIRSAPPT